MTPAELLTDAFERIRTPPPQPSTASPTPSSAPAGTRGELDRVAGLAPGPGPGRPRRRRGGHRAGVDRAGLRDPLRPAVRLRRDRLRHDQRGGGPRAGGAELLADYVRAVHDATVATSPADARGPRPDRRRAVGPAGHPGRAAGQRGQTTTCSTPARRRTSAGCWAPELVSWTSAPGRRPGAVAARSTARTPKNTLSLDRSIGVLVTSPTVDHVVHVRSGRLPPHHLVAGEVGLGAALPAQRGVVGQVGGDDPDVLRRARRLGQRPQHGQRSPGPRGRCRRSRRTRQVAELLAVLHPDVLVLVGEVLVGLVFSTYLLPE